MRRILLLLTLLLLLSCSAVTAQVPKIGVGVFGGLDIPVVQGDQDQGTIFGLRGKLKVVPGVTIEPRISFTKYGDPEFDEFAADLEGSKVNSYGVDAVLGAPFGAAGFRFFGVLGAGFYTIKRDQTDQDETNLGWSAGLGFALGVAPMVSIDARGKLNVAPYEDGGSKKSLTATAGLNYYFGM